MCMLFKCSMNKHCEYANVCLSGNHIDFVQDIRTCIFDFSQRISRNTNSILETCFPPKVYIFLSLENGGVQYYYNYGPFHTYYFIFIY